MSSHNTDLVACSVYLARRINSLMSALKTEGFCLREIAIKVNMLFTLLLFVYLFMYFVYVCLCSIVVACLFTCLSLFTLMLVVYFCLFGDNVRSPLFL